MRNASDCFLGRKAVDNIDANLFENYIYVFKVNASSPFDSYSFCQFDVFLISRFGVWQLASVMIYML